MNKRKLQLERTIDFVEKLARMATEPSDVEFFTLKLFSLQKLLISYTA